ncbi:MAG TPA: hypothetical protein VKA46_43345 [Gemmataceae bacterium]|nr:hypothetical protein [Gemmataceae bacterium]
MNAVRYLVAKYVPDLRRMEPRNVGVVVWAGGEVVARFAAERPDQPGTVDDRCAPSFVRSLSAYKQWVRFWRKELEKAAVRPLRGGEPVPRSSPDFLKVLAATGRGNFLLMDGGLLLDPVTEGELPQLADYLYKALVAEVAPAEEPAAFPKCPPLDVRVGVTDMKTVPSPQEVATAPASASTGT